MWKEQQFHRRDIFKNMLLNRSHGIPLEVKTRRSTEVEKVFT